MSNAEVDARFADPHSTDGYWANEKLRQELEPLVRTHVCECRGDLTLSRLPSGESLWPWSLKCQKCGWRTPEQIVRRRSLTDQWRAFIVKGFKRNVPIE